LPAIEHLNAFGPRQKGHGQTFLGIGVALYIATSPS